MGLAEPAPLASLGSQGWLSGKPTVEEHPSHVGPGLAGGPWAVGFCLQYAPLRAAVLAVFTLSEIELLTLLAQGGTREVTDRHNSDQTLAFRHRKVPEVPRQHDLQGLLDIGFGAHRDGVSGHPWTNRLARGTNVVGQRSNEIPLREDAFQPRILHHEHRPHSLNPHDRHRRCNGG